MGKMVEIFKKIKAFSKEMRAAQKLTPSKEKRFIMGVSAFMILGSSVSMFLTLIKNIIKAPGNVETWGWLVLWMLIVGTVYWFLGYGIRVISYAKKDPVEFKKALDVLDEESYVKKCKKDKQVLTDTLPSALTHSSKKSI